MTDTADFVRDAVVASWPLHDYVSPGLQVVRPDAAFPHMRAGDPLHHPWKYLRRDVPHTWYSDERFPAIGFLNRDEATLLHNLALQFRGEQALEIGSWFGWSTCHLALAGVYIDVIDPAHDEPLIRSSVAESMRRSGVSDRVNLIGGRSPESIASLRKRWRLFFIDGDHEGSAPVRDTLACLPYAMEDCAFAFHDLASPAVASAMRLLAQHGFNTIVYQTAQIMGFAWRGNVEPVHHIADPEVAWQIPAHVVDLFGRSATSSRTRAYDRSLHEVELTSKPSRPPSVCIVSNEVDGPSKNGGIGTAMTALAETLASEGLPVTILYTGALWQPSSDLDRWRRDFASRGITLDALTLDDIRSLAGPVKQSGFVAPWLVYRYLRERDYDVIHFNDCCGDGSLSFAAKRTGLAFRDSLLVLALHSPSRWVFDLNRTLPSNVLLAAYNYAEHLSTACADLVWSPSRYMLEWAREHAFEMPEQTFVQPYALSTAQAKAPAPALKGVREIVFFGRLEERKGLRIFCAAIDRLRDELAERQIAVTFLGKPGTCNGVPSLAYIEKRAASWPFTVRTLTDAGRADALRYVGSDKRLAVMPSPEDNSPCTVYEALEYGVPFIAASTGGIPEIIAAADRNAVLFDYSVDALTAKLRDAIDRGTPTARPAQTQNDIHGTWHRAHRHWESFLPPAEIAPNARPLTFAAVIDHRAGARLDLTIGSLDKCESLRRFIVLNRDGEKLSFPTINMLTDDPQQFDAEIAGIAESAVLFIHSGVAVEPERLEAMLGALASTGADGLVPAARITSKKSNVTVVPLGGSPVFSMIEGPTFTGALLVRRTAVDGARGPEHTAIDAPFLGLADRCISMSARIWPYPDVVAHWTDTTEFSVKSSDPVRIAAYRHATGDDQYYMLAMAYGASVSRPHRTLPRQIAVVAIDRGLAPLVRVAASVFRRARRWIN